MTDRLDQEVIDALHDAMVIYAPEFSKPEMVSQAWERTREAGGYLNRMAVLKEKLIKRNS